MYIKQHYNPPVSNTDLFSQIPITVEKLYGPSLKMNIVCLLLRTAE